MSRSGTLERVADPVAAAVSSWRTTTETPGVAVALVTEDREPVVLVDGVADVARADPVRPDHRFQYGSITKSFTALAAFRLAERDALDLEAPIAEYLRWFRVRSQHGPILVRHLLTHTGGLVIGADLSGTTPFDVWLLRSTTAAWEPGARYSYSNAGYAAVGYALETATGRSFGDLVRELVLDPIGMRETSLSIDRATRPLEAVGYRRRVEADLTLGPIGVAPWVAGANAEGSAVGTAGDLGRYLRTLLRSGATPEGERLLRPKSFRRMVSRQARIEPGRWYAYGLRTFAIDGRPVIEHGGEMIGFRASMVGDVSAGVGAVVLANLVDTKPFHLSEFIVRSLRAARAGRPLPRYSDPPLTPPRRLPTSSPAELPRVLRGLLGRYSSTSPWRRPLDVAPGLSGLLLRVAGEDDAELVPVGRRRFRVGSALGPEEATFDAVVEGRALRLSLSGHPYLRDDERTPA